MPEVNRNVIHLNYVISFLVFSGEYKETISNLDEMFRRDAFENLCFYIQNNYFITEFDSNITNNLYHILNYFREFYHDSADVDLINNSIATLNKLNNKKSIYVPEFNCRFKYIYNFRSRRDIIKHDMDYLKDSVNLSIINDVIFLENLFALDTFEFCEENKEKIIPLTNIMALMNDYPMIFKDEELVSKMLELLKINIENNSNKNKYSNKLYLSSVLTEGKVLKKMR